eukprot:331282-Amphidinium_carterae.1
MSTVCQEEWSSGQGWGYNAVNDFQLCFNPEWANDDFEDEESWLTFNCERMCADFAFEGTEVVRCAGKEHVFEHITAAPSPMCVPRGTLESNASTSTETTTTGTAGTSDPSDDDSVGRAPSSSPCTP